MFQRMYVNHFNMQDFFDWKEEKDKEDIINDIIELKMKEPQTQEIKLAIQKLQQKLNKK